MDSPESLFESNKRLKRDLALSQREIEALQYRLEEINLELDETTSQVTFLSKANQKLKDEIKLNLEEATSLASANQLLASENDTLTESVMKAKEDQIQQMNSLNEANETLVFKEKLLKPPPNQ